MSLRSPQRCMPCALPHSVPAPRRSFMDHYLDVPIGVARALRWLAGRGVLATLSGPRRPLQGALPVHGQSGCGPSRCWCALRVSRWPCRVVEQSIPGPLADRMEFIRLSGYVAHEKVPRGGPGCRSALTDSARSPARPLQIQIAKQYLEPVARKETGVADTQAVITETGGGHPPLPRRVADLASDYTDGCAQWRVWCGGIAARRVCATSRSTWRRSTARSPTKLSRVSKRLPCQRLGSRLHAQLARTVCPE